MSTGSVSPTASAPACCYTASAAAAASMAASAAGSAASAAAATASGTWDCADHRPRPRESRGVQNAACCSPHPTHAPVSRAPHVCCPFSWVSADQHEIVSVSKRFHCVYGSTEVVQAKLGTTAFTIYVCAGSCCGRLTRRQTRGQHYGRRRCTVSWAAAAAGWIPFGTPPWHTWSHRCARVSAVFLEWSMNPRSCTAHPQAGIRKLAQ